MVKATIKLVEGGFLMVEISPPQEGIAHDGYVGSLGTSRRQRHAMSINQNCMRMSDLYVQGAHKKTQL